jgi:hypothetical protein
MSAPDWKSPFLARAFALRYQIVLGLGVIVAGIVNAHLMYDDLYLIPRFQHLSDSRGFFPTLFWLFLSLDLGGHEYRLYGTSKILHFFLWEMFGSRAWIYGGLIAAAQFVSGLGIQRLLRGLQIEPFQAWAVALAWIISPFAVTTCFHHFAYLLLPYDLTIACALVIQRNVASNTTHWRTTLAIALLSFCIATTGEAHIPVAFAVLAVVGFLTRSPMPYAKRGRMLLVSGVTIAATVIVHRMLWEAYAPQIADRRFIFTLTDWDQSVSRTLTFLQSLAPGAAVQVEQVLAFAGWRAVRPAVFTLLCAALIWRIRAAPQPASRSGLGVPAVLCLMTAMSIVITWALAAFTPNMDLVYPRRYGYVPNTLAAMAIVGLFAAPSVRRIIGRAPVFLCLMAIGWIWLTLVSICLPVIRKHDSRVWHAVAKAIDERPGASVLFVRASNSFNIPRFNWFEGLRGADFPDIFESTFSGYLWEFQYAREFLHARATGYRYDAVNATDIKLTGNSGSSTIVPRDSVIAVANMDWHRTDWQDTRLHATVFRRWDDFLASVAAHGALGKAGWEQFLQYPDEEQIAIDLGERNGAGALPDKKYADRAAGAGFISNYGLEEGDDSIYAPPHGGPGAWWMTNRNGSFTYRIDFTDDAPKIVALDWLEYWQHATGNRKMLVEAALDDQWYRVGVVNIAAEAGQTPFVLELPTAGAKTFRVRLSPAPTTTDLPFLPGIRVTPVRP